MMENKSKIFIIICSTLNLIITILFCINYFRLLDVFNIIGHLLNNEFAIKWYHHIVTIISFIIVLGIFDILAWGILIIIKNEQVSPFIKNLIMVVSACIAIVLFYLAFNSKAEIVTVISLYGLAGILSIFSIVIFISIIKNTIQE